MIFEMLVLVKHYYLSKKLILEQRHKGSNKALHVSSGKHY